MSKSLIPLENLRLKRNINSHLLDFGQYSDVYNIFPENTSLLNGKSLVAKIIKLGGTRNLNSAIRMLRKEYIITKHLYEKGVNVPQPLGIFNLKNSGLQFKRYPSFVMEHIKEDSTLTGSESEKLYCEQINRAKKLGFYPYDSWSFKNTIISDCKIYLIDFGLWQFKDNFLIDFYRG